MFHQKLANLVLMIQRYFLIDQYTIALFRADYHRSLLSKTRDGRRHTDEVTFGDVGYTSDSYKRGARALGLSWKVNDKRKPKQGSLSNKQRKRNRQQSRVRTQVEHLFRIIKCQLGIGRFVTDDWRRTGYR